MAEFKYLALIFISVFLLAALLNLAVAPYSGSLSPNNESILYGFAGFVENGTSVYIDVPVFGEIDFSFNPVSMLWLGFDGITDFMVTQINLLTYVPDSIIIPLIAFFIAIFGFVIFTLIRGN
jgi:hypothetical protein